MGNQNFKDFLFTPNASFWGLAWIHRGDRPCLRLSVLGE